MATNSTRKPATNSGSASNSQRGPRIGSLTTISSVGRELRRVYKLSRLGKLETADLSRYANVLMIMVNVLRDSDLEKRIQQLEATNNAQHQQP